MPNARNPASIGNLWEIIVDQNAILFIAVVVLVALIVRPDLALQAAGLLLFASAPFANPLGGASTPAITMSMGLGLVGIGRIVFHLRTIVALARAASPDASNRVPAKRWLL